MLSRLDPKHVEPKNIEIDACLAEPPSLGFPLAAGAGKLHEGLCIHLYEAIDRAIKCSLNLSARQQPDTLHLVARHSQSSSRLDCAAWHLLLLEPPLDSCRWQSAVEGSRRDPAGSPASA